MAWRKANQDDLIASMSTAEIDALKTSANWDSDPVQILLKRQVAWARDQIRTNGNVRMSPDEMELPEGCIGPTMDLLVYSIATRLGGTTTEERKAAREDALKYFERIARRWVTVENYGAAAVERTGGAAIEIVQTAPMRMSDRNLENL